MTERRTARGGADGRASTRRRRPVVRDEPEILDEEETVDEEPEIRDEDELLDADEPEEVGDDVGDESRDVGEPVAADADRSAGNGRERPARPASSAMTAVQAARAALSQITELTAKQAEGVTGVERTEDGWAVGVELVEDQRIPSSSDILATYEIAISPDGEMQSYRRLRRYPRGRGDTEEL